MNTTLVRPAPLFLRPTARDYPVDEVCAQIAQALEARNWDVPGIKVEFSTYGTGTALFRILYEVRGKGWTLKYHRSQGLNDGFYDMAAIHRIAANMKDIELWPDDLTPSLHEYTGNLDDWDKDRDWFLDGTYRFRKELEGRYVKFQGECRCGESPYSRHTHTGVPAPWLVAEGGKEYETQALLDEFAQWLKDNVLAVIEGYPETRPDYSRFEVADIPFPSGLPPIFCFAKMEDAYRIRQAEIDMAEIRPQDRYGLPQERSLVNLGIRDKHHPHDKAFRETARFCGFGEIDETSTIWKGARDSGLSIALGPGGYYSGDAEFVCRVTPNRANDIYVADYAVYLSKRKEIMAISTDRKEFTLEELNEMDLAFARTLIPITEYDGSYEQPVVLIQRELGFDEVELVAGPMTDHLKQYWREQHG